MTKATIASGAFVIALVLLAVGLVVLERNVDPAPPPAVTSDHAATSPAEAHPGFLYGRITIDGATYEGRLRWGGFQEAFWGDYFDGAKHDNPWAAYAPGEQQPRGSPIEIFGLEIGGPDGPDNFGRPFMARFGDIARIVAHFGDVQVTLKSGTTVELDRFAAGDIDDGVRVWDRRHGVVDVDARAIRTIEFLPTAPLAAAPGRPHGTVRTRVGDFTGFIPWGRYDGVGDDALEGETPEGERRLRYDIIRSIARRGSDGALVTLLDGGEMVLADSHEVGRGNRIYVEDRRYGRVLIPWDAFERVDFSPGGSGPGYGDFPAGRPLAGQVTTRDGRRLAGRLVYDFDESETTEMFDVSAGGVDYNIPFALIASIAPRGGDGRGAGRASVILRTGEELQVEPNGDLGERNAGLLIFVDGRERPDYVPWSEVVRIDLDRPPGDR